MHKLRRLHAGMVLRGVRDTRLMIIVIEYTGHCPAVISYCDDNCGDRCAGDSACPQPPGQKHAALAEQRADCQPGCHYRSLVPDPVHDVGIKLGFTSVLLSHVAFSVRLRCMMMLPHLQEMSPTLIDAAVIWGPRAGMC